ncbi:UNVERIFIED_CONTAM: hypothetical protein FKN15_055705 [Acipenser sinensis]
MTILIFITLVWEEESMPGDLRDTVIVTIFKKGDKSDCGNYRGISLLSATGKVITRILLNRLLPVAEELLPESPTDPPQTLSQLRQGSSKAVSLHLHFFQSFSPRCFTSPPTSSLQVWN